LDAVASWCSAFDGSFFSISASTSGDPPLAFVFVVSPSGPVLRALSAKELDDGKAYIGYVFLQLLEILLLSRTL